MEEDILRKVGPTVASQKLRMEVFQLMRRNIEKCLARYRPYVAVYGSWPLQTYTPCGDLDLTIILPNDLSDTEAASILATVRSQMEFVAKIRPAYAIRDFLEIDAEVKLLKFMARGIPIDLSVNQTGGLFTWRLMEFVDSLTDNHMLKRAVLLVKAWATYEARICGSRYGLLTSYALGILTVCTINTIPASRLSPLHVFSCFLDLCSSLDWEHSIVTCFGVLPRSDYTDSDSIGRLAEYPHLLFTRKHLEILTGRVEASPSFQWRAVNIADPLKPENNVGRSVSRGNWERMKLAFQAAQVKAQWRGVEALFQTVAAMPGTSPSESEPEKFHFSNELESVQKSLRRALSSPSPHPHEPRSGKWWLHCQPRKVSVANR